MKRGIFSLTRAEGSYIEMAFVLF